MYLQLEVGQDHQCKSSSHHDDPVSLRQGRRRPTSSQLLEHLPHAVWRSCLLPFLDRLDWNALVSVSRGVHNKLVGVNTNNATVNITEDRLPTPWPERCFSTRHPTASSSSNSIAGTSSGGSIESFDLSADGEYLAYGSMMGNIQVWSRRTGVLRLLSGQQLRRRRRYQDNTPSVHGSGSSMMFVPETTEEGPPQPGDEDYKRGGAGAAEAYGDHHMTRQSSASMSGSILKFAPVGHVLACGYENRIILWDVSSLDTQQRILSSWPSTPIIQTLQTDKSLSGRSSAIYEVTFVDFSADGSRLVARHGKAAYIFGKVSMPIKATMTDAKSCLYVLLYHIPLSSSRCPMAISPCLCHLAVTINASSGNLDEKGTMDVWTLPDTDSVAPSNTERACASAGVLPPFPFEMDAASHRIVAYQKQVIRGLEYFKCNHHSPKSSLSSHGHPWLVSASLQGEIKIWMYQDDGTVGTSHAHDAHKDISGEEEEDNDKSHETNASGSSPFLCIYSFQTAGKIFSLALSSPSCSNESASSYLAVGQARGQVRVWKINQATTTANCNDDGTSNDQSALGSVIANTSAKPKISLEECLVLTDVGEHTHHDNIKLLSFTPDGRNIVASRAYDGRVYLRNVPRV